MSGEHREILDWIDTQAPATTQRLIEWAQINTGSENIAGLQRFGSLLKAELESLGGAVSEIALEPAESIDARGAVYRPPVGKAVSAVKRPDSALRVFLCIHMDTVYAADHAFQRCTPIDPNTLQGPGVADAKGGIIVLLTALAALERSKLAGKIGWEVLFNPDEEVGSRASAPLLAAAAKRNHVGLLFEPAASDGSLVERRKGSGNYAIVVRGKSAHAGRDFTQGRNAVVAGARLISGLHDLNGELGGVTINVGKLDGGGPANVVPDLAIVRFNVRTTEIADEARLMQRIHKLLDTARDWDGISVELHGGMTSPPKIPDTKMRTLMSLAERCGKELSIPIRWTSTGGVCDGNKLAAAGLANLDTLGPVGGNLHSLKEYVLLDSLSQRAKLAALILLNLAAGEPMV